MWLIWERSLRLQTYAAAWPILNTTDTAPLLLFALYAQHFIASCLNLVTTIVHPASTQRWVLTTLTLAANAILFATILRFPIDLPPSPEEADIRRLLAAESVKQGNPADGGAVGKEPLMPSPERTVSLGSWFVFGWVGPMMSLASKRKIQYPDIWILPVVSQAESVYRVSASLRNSSLVVRVFWSNAHDSIISLLLSIVSSALSYAAPFCLNRILKSLTPPPPGQEADPDERKSAFIYAFVMFVATYARAQVDLQELYCYTRGSTRCRSMLMQEIYAKALKRRDTAGVACAKASGASHGKVQQLMSGDTQKLAGAAGAITAIAQIPLELFLSVFGLYKLLGWTCFLGLLFAAVTSPVQSWIMKRRVQLQKTVLSARDDRTEKLTEFINAVRFIKSAQLLFSYPQQLRWLRLT